ncbi:MAG TPA: alpha/beta fold hydrolase [Gaiellaceae bacterium]
MFARLSSPLEQIRDHYTVVVIGSGYGGAIAASRLARAGQDVCVLERGREFMPGEFPDTQLELTAQTQADTPAAHVGSRTALVDIRVNKDMNVLIGCGLGGTSLINANVALEAEPAVFADPVWPRALVDDLDTLVADGLARARAMLEPTPYPESAPTLRKLEALERSAEAMGLPFYRPPINVTFADRVNAAGIEQPACTLCGDCVAGCNVGAKNTTQMNYLPDAKRHGAEIFTLASVRRIEQRGDRWLVHYQALDTGREGFDAPTLFVSADIVVLAAGALGSSEIMLRSKETGLSLSDRVGARFSGNGDVLGFGYNCDEPMNGIGFGTLHADDKAPVGPTITGIVDVRGQAVLDEGMVIEEGSVPSGLGKVMPALLAATSKLMGKDTDSGFRDETREARRELESIVRGPYHGAANNTQVFLVMTHDDGNGRFYLDHDRLRVDWPGVGRQPIFHSVAQRLLEATVPHGGTFIKNPMWSKFTKQDLITVHPLGGCGMGDDAEHGVVDHGGRAFAGASGTDVHRGLYVADGSVMPRPLGVNPLLTISAFAERTCVLIAREHGWTIDYAAAPATPLESAEPRIGIKFTERMAGAFSTAVTDEFETAAARGKADDSEFEFTLTMVSSDLERLLTDESHGARLLGTATCAALSPEPLTVTQGHFNLFVRDPDQPKTRRMRYTMRLTSREGKVFSFEGYKLVHDDRGLFDPWTDTTTLFVTVWDGTQEDGTIAGRGILRIATRDFMRQMTTMEVTGAPNRRSALAAHARFGRYFAGSLFDVYGGIFSRDAALAPDAAPRKRRELRLDEPSVEYVTTDDGVRIRLTRFAGEGEPVVLAHGLGTSSETFMLDTVETSLAEYLASNGHDVWLLDWRGSSALDGALREHTLDDVAQHDWPAAIAAIRAATGAPGVHVVAEGAGSLALHAALLNGLTGVASVVSLGVAPEIVAPNADKLGRGLRDVDGDLMREDKRGRVADKLLRFQRIEAEERCESAVCRRATYVYGLLYEHDQLSDTTHETIHELVGLPNKAAMDHLRTIAERGSLGVAEGELERLALPITYVHGAESAVFRPEGTERFVELLRGRFNGAGLHSATIVPDYGHLDLLIGKNAVADVYPAIHEHLARVAASSPVKA